MNESKKYVIEESQMNERVKKVETLVINKQVNEPKLIKNEQINDLSNRSIG